MTQLFRDMRWYGLVTIMLFSAAVLGLAAYLASVFLPHIQHDFSIFSLIVPSLTLLVLLIILYWSSPRTELVFIFILGVLWLTMGAWASDILGSTQCDALGGQRTATKNGSISAKSYCYEMKVIEAFSFFLFCLFAIFCWVIIALTSRAQALGRPYAWAEPIFELPWFGQWPGYPEGGAYNSAFPQYAYPAGQPLAMGQYPGAASFPAAVPGGGYVVQQNPGHSVVIQPNQNGRPTITQVPGMVTTA